MPISRTETGYSPGATGASAARVPGVPVYSSNGSGSITFSFDTQGNNAVVEYALYVTGAGVGIGYLKADGTDNGATEVWQTAAAWGATITATGLTDFVAYTFKAKAKNEMGVETAFSSNSAIMSTLPDIDYSVNSGETSRPVTGGDTILDETYGIVVSGNEVAAADATQTDLPEYYGDITFGYKLINDLSTASRILPEYSKDGTTWYTATKGTGGDNITGLTATPAGVEHTFVWDSYSDGGTSLQDLTVYFRITPYDASPTGGDAATTVESDSFIVNNRPGVPVWVASDGRTYGKDTTPSFESVIPYLYGGTRGFPEITFTLETGNVPVMTRSSVDSVAGWEYETEPGVWVSLTPAGIPDTVIDGVNKMKYTVQPADALAPDDYYITGRMGETRDA